MYNDVYPLYQPNALQANLGLQGFQNMYAPTRPMIFGRVVAAEGDITPNDLPLDCSSGVFPMKDESAIYIKRWNSDCTITTEKYVKETDIPKVSDPYEDLKIWLEGKFNSLASYEGGVRG